MIRCRKFITLMCLLLLAVKGYSDNLEFCPKGFFSNAKGTITFSPVPYSGDYQLNFSDEGIIRFCSPIFPGYKLARKTAVKSDASTKTVVSKQYCKEFDADVVKKFTEMNGGVVATVTYRLKPGKTLKKPATFRMLLPLKTFAGKLCEWNGTSVELPKNITQNYILLQGRESAVFRFKISSELEVGIKLISGIEIYRLADCRHHGKPEQRFHISGSLSGDTFKYYVCVLKPGQPFPSLKNKAVPSPSSQAGNNLLRGGTGFEVGPHGCRPFCFYSWNEAWTSPGIQPVFDDKTAFKGKYSLKLTAEDFRKKHGRFNYNQIVFTPIKLDPDKNYTLSCWMKSDRDNMATIMKVGEPWSNTLFHRSKVGKEWKRYSFSFKPDKFKLLNYRRIAIGINSHVTSGILWIDNVQLEEGKSATDYKPEPLEFGAAIEQPYKLFNSEEIKHGGITLRFRNNTGKSADFKINYQITDYWDKVVAKDSVVKQVNAQGNATYIVKFPKLPVGYYRVKFDNADGRFYDEAIFGVYKEMGYKRFLPLDWPLGCDASEGNPIVRKLGFGWTRCWNFVFKDICPEEGKFDFKKTDIIVKRCKEAKLNLMPILGPSFHRSSYHKKGNVFIPEWGTEKKSKSSVKASHVEEVSYPKIGAWKTYVKAVVSRYKGSIKAWEILNEPNCWLTPEEYAVYMKAAYESAKEADPDCVIVGGCATSDWSGEPAPWTRRVLEIDKCKSLDVLSIHMYSGCSPESYKDIGSDKMLKYLKGLLAKHGRNIPVWHTEKSHNTTGMGYSMKKLNEPPVYMREPRFRVPDFRNKAEYLLRETLIDSTVGKGPYFWFGALPNDIYIMSNSNSYGLSHTEYDGSPCPEVIAANGLARMLEGRNHPNELVKLGESVYCALYQGEKGTLAALWDSEKQAVINLGSLKISCEIYNFFGASQSQSDSVRLGSAPVYLVFNGRKAAEIKTALLKCEFAGKDNLSISGGLESQNGKNGIAVYVRNRLAKTIKNTLRISPEGPKLKILNKKSDCSLLPMQYNRTFFEAELPSSSADPMRMECSVGKQKSTLALLPYGSLEELEAVLCVSTQTAAFPGGKITIDGNLSDWSQEGMSGAVTADKVKIGRDKWTDILDLAVKVRFRYDEKNLYVAARVFDNKLERNVPAREAYASDCVELFLGFDPSTKVAATRSNKVYKTGKFDFQLLLAPGMKGGKYPKATAWNCKLKNDGDIKIASHLFRYGYTVEAAIPWQNMKPGFKAKKGTELLMTYQAKDADQPGEAAKAQIFWTGNDGNWMTPENWGKLVLK